MIEGWRYYNHAMIPITAPHEKPNLQPVLDESIWMYNGGGAVLLARWTTEWDLKQETNWWYVIKDRPFDISKLKAKRRYEITKGIKNFKVQKTCSLQTGDELLRITKAAYTSWPEKYRPTIDDNSFKMDLENWSKSNVYVAKYRKNQKLCSYAVVNVHDGYAEFSVLRSDPQYEKLAVNAAIVYGILEDFKDKFEDGFYISDGARSIRHETAFQDYLQKYFGFRKSYCNLHIKYRFWVGLLVKLLFPLRRFINSDSSMGSKISSILKMEELTRNNN